MATTAENTATVGELRQRCLESASTEEDTPAVPEKAKVLHKRMTIEALNNENRFLLTPHNRNFVLPGVYTDQPNTTPFLEVDSKTADLQHTEIEFQLSMKVLIAQDLLHNNGNLYVAYTNRSFWQAYNTGVSRPFRETNHEPELILAIANDWELLGFRNVMNQVVFSHQSNGQSGDLSRSWNRIKLNSVFEKGNFAFNVSPWYRIPEDLEDDDNPDIKEYYGNYELTGAYARKDHIVSVMTRRPFSDKGAWELSWSFPLTSTVRGYIKAFNGYGASLIDYNTRTRSIGLGVTFTDIL
ncbi:phospholipase A [Gilvimarinus sp. 1_MG-2023]|uniref:phospholipase A n=1 Tax=Gilvimarinus sp. 1_MG-2023 TaxID=3062638 RepID=UPI0026E25E82|nr:phospholipase A [Gilvimarinus sp. 1_MG-2023]MDO6747883.1 phospholipase A [Gilvimarinus sp. 1_MG-2023]